MTVVDPWPDTVGRTVRHREGSGSPLVLIHGFAMCAETWLPVLPLLSAHHDVVVLTLPGHFRGEPVAADDPFDLGHTLDLLEAALDEVGVEKAHLVGNSLGGWLAAELARRGRGLTYVGLSPAGGWELGSREARRTTGRLIRGGRLLPRIEPRLAQLSRQPRFRRIALSDLVADGATATTADECELLMTSAARCQVYAAVLAQAPTQAPPAYFPRLPCPSALVWGTKDRLLPSPRYSERWRRALPGVTFTPLPGVGHVPTYDDPKALADAVLATTLG
jgi:pimeloyl-ACP methyl ester carboxylesterase